MHKDQIAKKKTQHILQFFISYAMENIFEIVHFGILGRDHPGNRLAGVLSAVKTNIQLTINHVFKKSYAEIHVHKHIQLW